MEKDANIIHFKQENEWNMYQNNAWEIENLVFFFCKKNMVNYSIVLATT